MKHLMTVIVIALVLAAAVAGCSGAHRYDARLMAADSLMQAAPDSALVLIGTVCRDSLADEGDRAYRDLLLTQARYRNYITATSDSDINRALAWYRAHSGEREKLTRALIYKGAVMEELGHPDSAMLYYKQAEATAAPDDYFNLGYAKFRMGYLYGQIRALDGKDIQMYEEAMECFSHTNSLYHQFISVNNLGCVYRESHPQKADSLLLKAQGLARNLNDTSLIINNLYALLVLYDNQQQYGDALHLLSQLNSFNPEALDYKLCFTAADVYSAIGMPDSASYYIELARQNHTQDKADYRMMLLGSLSMLALLQGDTLLSLKLDQQSEQIADSLMANPEIIEVVKVETNFDKLSQQSRMHSHQNKRATLWIIIGFLSLIAVLLAIFAGYHYRKTHHYDRLIADLKRESMNSSFDNHIEQLNINDQHLKDFVKAHTSIMRDVIAACYRAPKNHLADEIKRIVQFQNDNKDAWTELYHYIDLEYNNIMSRTREQHPQLDERNLLLLALTCLGASCSEIAVIQGYANASTIGGNRKRLMKKMGFDGSIHDYIALFSNPDNQEINQAT